jgi:hypothetical protein
MKRDAPSDQLLVRFREAAVLDRRLLELESWLQRDRQPYDSPEFWKKWIKAAWRLLRLVKINPSLEPHHDIAHRYLLAVHELGATP